MKKIKIILREIPDYVIEKSTITFQVMFVSIFALVFINIYSPFNASSWFDVGRIEFFFYSSAFILFGMLIIVVSKLIFFLIARRRKFTYLLFGIWHVK